MTTRKKSTHKTEELTKKIWLAGLGAYGQGMDNLQHGYEKMNDQAREFFEELVARGEKLEKETKENVQSTRTKIKEQTEKNRESISAHIHELREKISTGLTSASIDRDEVLEELHSRVSLLTETLSKLIRTPAKKSAAAKKASSKKTPARQPAARKTGTAKKTSTAKVPRKTTARKTTARKPATKATTTKS